MSLVTASSLMSVGRAVLLLEHLDVVDVDGVADDAGDAHAAALQLVLGHEELDLLRAIRSITTFGFGSSVTLLIFTSGPLDVFVGEVRPSSRISWSSIASGL